MARRRQEQSSAETTPAVAAELFATSPAVEEQAPEHVPAPAPAPKAWRVVVGKRVSLWGHLTELPAGTIIKAGEYGDAGFARLREQGVLLEPV